MASNLRVLVSNLGDGNWGVTGTTSADSNLLDATAATSASKSIFFPPAFNANGTENKSVTPTAGDSDMSPLAASSNFAGWTSKTQWMVQVVTTNLGTVPDGGGGTNPAVVTVSVVRPTGVEELIVSITATGTESYGGFGDEAIVGPVSYFKFTNSATGGAPSSRCYVIGWNYGDISDGLAS